ncbi:MAG: hypothetical protein R2706_05525 [Acidimicrobiales bacterium]
MAGTDIVWRGALLLWPMRYDVITSTRSYKKALPAEAARGKNWSAVRAASSTLTLYAAFSTARCSPFDQGRRCRLACQLGRTLGRPPARRPGAVGAAAVAAVGVGALTGVNKAQLNDPNVIESATVATAGDDTPDTLPFADDESNGDESDNDQTGPSPRTVTARQLRPPSALHLAMGRRRPRVGRQPHVLI